MRAFFSILAKPFQMVIASVRPLFSPRTIIGLSLPWRVALIVFLVLLVFAISVIVINRNDPLWGMFVRLIILCFVIAIPLAVRYAVALWLEGPPSRYPEIDRAWEAGLAAMEARGLDPMKIPIFLVHGVADLKQVESLFHASHRRFPVSCVPDGPGPLHWYAAPDAIFLVLTNVSQLGELTLLAQTQAAGGGGPSMQQMLSMTLNAMDYGAASSHGGGGGRLGQTISPGSGGQSSGTGAPGNSGQRAILGMTISPNDSLTPTGFAGGRGVQVDVPTRRELTGKLQHICRLLTQLRQTYAPINGVLSAVSIDLASGDKAEVAEVSQALKGDLDAILKTTQLRPPCLTLITGMENELGFRELMRRIGRDKANGRFGKGARLGTLATPENLEAVAANACAAFEIYAYSLFRESDGLTAFGNPKLYALICRIRSQVRERLEAILVQAYAEAEEKNLRNAPFYGGCYFSATGDADDLQAFVAGVFDRFVDPRGERLQDSLEWTPQARRQQTFHEGLAQFGAILATVLFVATIYVLFFFERT